MPRGKRGGLFGQHEGPGPDCLGVHRGAEVHQRPNGSEAQETALQAGPAGVPGAKIDEQGDEGAAGFTGSSLLTGRYDCFLEIVPIRYKFSNNECRVNRLVLFNKSLLVDIIMFFYFSIRMNLSLINYHAQFIHVRFQGGNHANHQYPLC